MTSYNPASPDFPFTLGIEEEYQVVDPQTVNCARTLRRSLIVAG
jgi:gamma-glutamyl:cysteine ligase YbdK (ATP-grasp superfamily)